MLQPVVRRTWAPEGRTPIHYSWDRHGRISVISAVSVSPLRQRLGLCFAVHKHNIVTDDFEQFAALLLRRAGRPIILIIDRWQVHRSGAGRLLQRFKGRIHIEWLPAYAPELNPAEQVWARTKYVDLANYIPRDVRELGKAVRRSLCRTSAQQKLLRSFFEHAKLKL